MQNVTTKVQMLTLKIFCFQVQLLSTTSYYKMLHCEQSLIYQFCLYSFSLKRFSIWLKLCQLEPNQRPWPWTDMDCWWPGSLPPVVPLKFLEKSVTDVIPLGWTVINEVLKCASQQIFRVGLMKYGQSLIITYFVLFLCLRGLLPSLLSDFPYVTRKSISVHCHQGYLISRKHERGTGSEDAQTYPSQMSTY